jgi:hypothetical protein
LHSPAPITPTSTRGSRTNRTGTIPLAPLGFPWAKVGLRPRASLDARRVRITSAHVTAKGEK